MKNNNWEIKFISIELRQKQGEQYINLVIKGAGSIICENYALSLIFNPSNYHDFRNEICNLYSHSKRGNLLDESYFFQLVGIDDEDIIYYSDHINLMNYFCEKKEIKVPIKELKFECRKKTTDLVEIRIPGSYEFPFNDKTLKFDKSFSETTPKQIIHNVYKCIIFNNIEAKFIRNESYVDVIFTNYSNQILEYEILLSYCKRIMEPLSIIQGKFCKPFFTLINCQGILYYTIASIKKIDLKNLNIMPRPLNNEINGSVLDIESFTSLYLDKFQKNWDFYFLFWYKICEASDNCQDVLSLVLVTAIEGIVKNYFDLSAKKLSADEKKEIKYIIDQNIKIKYQSIAEKLKNAVDNPITKSIKKRLEDILIEIKIPTEKITQLTKSWNDLRNSCAHGEHYDFTNRLEFSKHLKRQKDSFAIFFHLIFALIKYNGSYIDYSSDGYPLKKFTV